MQPWAVASLFALVVWSVQRAVSKAALARLSTPQFYLLSAVVSLPLSIPVLIADPPPPSALPGALGVSVLMAATFGITTEAVRRGPVGRVSPVTGLSPALTALLALVFLGERVSATEAIGIVLAMTAVFLLGYRRSRERSRSPWFTLVLSSLAPRVRPMVRALDRDRWSVPSEGRASSCLADMTLPPLVCSCALGSSEPRREAISNLNVSVLTERSRQRTPSSRSRRTGLATSRGSEECPGSDGRVTVPCGSRNDRIGRSRLLEHDEEEEARSMAFTWTRGRGWDHGR